MTQPKAKFPDLGPGGVWLTVTQLAARKGVTKQSMFQRVARLATDGLIEVRQVGRNRLVELVSYDRAVGQVGDAFREQGAETKRETVSEADGSPKLREAQTQRAQYDAQLRALDLAERTGNLLAVKGPHGVEEGMVKAAEKIIRIVDRIPMSRLEEIDAARLIGPAEVRRVLKKMSYDMRREIAEELKLLAAEAEKAVPDGYEFELMNPTNPD